MNAQAGADYTRAPRTTVVYAWRPILVCSHCITPRPYMVYNQYRRERIFRTTVYGLFFSENGCYNRRNPT